MKQATACAALWLLATSAVQAQVPPPTEAFIVHARDAPMQTVFSWARNGKFFSAYPRENKEVPYDAAKIQVRMVSFPAGVMVREVTMDEGTRTHPNVAYEDIVFYQVSGRRVQVINQHSHEVNPGDASLQISGIHKRMDMLVAGTYVEFAMNRPVTPGAEGIWITAAEAAPIDMPAGAGYRVKSFRFPRYELKEVHLPKGARLAPQTDSIDTLFYVVSGRLSSHVGVRHALAEQGDALRAPARTAFGFDALEDSVLIYMGVTPPS